jgi:hypothetical protein
VGSSNCLKEEIHRDNGDNSCLQSLKSLYSSVAMSRLSSILFIALASALTALPEPIDSKFQKQGPCSGNTPSTRDQWCGFDIHSDYYSVVPNTGVTREYWLEISEITFTPDGVPRFAQAINGTMPGMRIPAWNDMSIWS